MIVVVSTKQQGIGGKVKIVEGAEKEIWNEASKEAKKQPDPKWGCRRKKSIEFKVLGRNEKRKKIDNQHGDKVKSNAAPESKVGNPIP